MKTSLCQPSRIISSLRPATALVAVVLATPTCGGLTNESSHEAGVDAWVAPRQDAHGRPDSTLESGSDAGGQHDAALLPACADVAKCCPQIPQVQLQDCVFTTHMDSSLYCQESVQFYQTEINDASCDGSPTGTPACETLAPCCSSVANMQACYDLVDSGNGPACATEYASLWNSLTCRNGPGP